MVVLLYIVLSSAGAFASNKGALDDCWFAVMRYLLQSYQATKRPSSFGTLEYSFERASANCYVLMRGGVCI